MSGKPAAPETEAVPGEGLPSARQIILSFSKVSIGSAFTLVVLAALNKVLAVVGGPATVGLFSLLRSTENTGISLASSDGDRALVRGLSSQTERRQADEYGLSVAVLMAAVTLAQIALLLAGAEWLSLRLFGQSSEDLIRSVRLLGLPILLAVGSTWLIAVLKSRLAVGRAVLARTLGAVAGLAGAYFAARAGSAVAIVLLLVGLEGTTLLAAMAFAAGERFRPGFMSLPWPRLREHVRSYLSVAGYLLVSGILRNLIVLPVRVLFVQLAGGLAGAGLFDAAWTMTAKYLLFLLDAISTYYLPLLSAARHEVYRGQLLRRLVRVAWAVCTPAVVALIVLKPLVVEILYSRGFLPALAILRWMLIGNYFQVSAWLFSTAMLAFGDVRSAFRIDVGWLALFLVGSATSLSLLHRPEGVGLTFMMAYIGMFLATGWYAVRSYGMPVTRRMATAWSLGLVVILGASAMTWQGQTVRWLPALLWLALAGVCVAAALDPRERASVLGRLAIWRRR